MICDISRKEGVLIITMTRRDRKTEISIRDESRLLAVKPKNETFSAIFPDTCSLDDPSDLRPVFSGNTVIELKYVDLLLQRQGLLRLKASGKNRSLFCFSCRSSPESSRGGRRAQAELVELSVGRCAQAPSIDDRGVMRTALDKGLEPFKEHGNASFGSLHNVSKV